MVFIKRIYVLVCTAYVLHKKYKDGAAVALADVAAAPFRAPIARVEELTAQKSSMPTKYDSDCSLLACFYPVCTGATNYFSSSRS